MKKEKRLTKRERKVLDGKGPSGGHAEHIHCVGCGRHLDPHEFDGGASASATILRCQHGSSFPSCTGCVLLSQSLLDEHDRSGQPVKPAAAWH